MSTNAPTSARKFANWPRLLAFLKPYQVRFVGAIFFAMLNGLTSLALMKGFPLVLKVVFPDNHASPKKVVLPVLEEYFTNAMGAFIEQFSHSSLVVLTILLVPLIMASRAFTSYLSGYLMNWVGLRVVTDLRQKVFEHLQRLSLDFFNRAHVGDLISRVSNDCQQAQSGVTNVLKDGIAHPFTLMVVATALVLKDWKFSLAALLLAPLCILPITIYGRKVRRTSKSAQENQGEIISCMHENITGIRVVKAFQMEDYEKRKFWDVCYRQFSFQMRIFRSTNILTPLIEIVAALGASAALYYASRRQMNSTDLIELLIGIYALYTPIKALSRIYTTIQQSLASTDRIFSILDTVSTVSESPSSRELAPILREISFDDVSFRYDSHWILQNISLKIPHHKTLALVGPSGAGKTTLLNLIPRFYDPTRGRVLMDDTDIRETTFLSLRRQIAIVTQETILFHDTIRNNIRYGSFDASDQEIMEAARRAHAHEFIQHQPQGYETVVGEKGAKLSGGQKQRIAIARALLKNPSILLLDEATSALDTESERLVQEALDELIRGRTVVVIAHRLSTVQRADSIVVLDHGRIVEQGRHEELLANEKLYRKLYDLQFREV